MTINLMPKPLNKEDFASFGQVIEKSGASNYPINNGRCIRFHDLATVDFENTNANPIINIFSGEPYELPLEINLVERHPYGSQAFFPLSENPYVVLVCQDDGGKPVAPVAFWALNNQGVNIYRNVWHGVLTPLVAKSDFLVVDLGGVENNLEEFQLIEPITILQTDH